MSRQLTRLTLFGRFQLEQAGGVVALPTRKTEALLAYLALHPGFHSREKLAALFWGDVGDAQARASLRAALPALRKALPPDTLLAGRDAIAFNPEAPLWLDVTALQAALAAPPTPEAVALYGGDLLPDCYDDWVLPLRTAWQQQVAAWLWQGAQQLRSQGEYGAAVELGQRLLAIEPAHEAAHQLLMACYLALGDRAAAVRQYERCEQRLWEELGVKPAAATRQLLQQAKTAVSPPSPHAQLGNLPHPLTSFIGRETAVSHLQSQLAPTHPTRLLTLTGAGGAGKTRLAIQLAHQLAPVFAAGGWWVELAPLTDPAYLPQLVAKVLGVREQPGQQLVDQLQTALASQTLLLVLDNCEHLVKAAAALAADLLSRCPQLKILVTSREPLGLTGELVYAVPPLSLPPASAQLPASQLAGYEAVRLFAARAAAVQPSFTLTHDNAAAVAQLCQQLDGMPLALELAAARLRVLTVEQLLSRLDDRFALLTGGSRTALPRQQTLRATVDWSYELLEEGERQLWQQLAVFVGSFSLAGATAVCSLPNPTNLLDLLTQLVDKSLLIAEPTGEEMRYRMLETIRQYGLEKLAAADDVRRRHLAWVCDLAETAENKLLGAEQLLWLRRLDAEYDNISAALRWAAEGDEEAVVLGLRLGGALWRYWDGRGYLAEAQARLGRLLGRWGEKTAVAPHAKALYSLGIVTHLQGEDAAATQLFMQSLAIWQRLGVAGELGAARAAHFIAFMALRRADYATAHLWYGQSNGRYHQLGDDWGLSEAQSQMGALALREGNIAEARRLQEEALAIKQRLGDARGILFSVWALGNIARLQADYPTARACYLQALQTAQQSDDKWSLPYCIEAFGYLALAEQQPQRAARIFAAAAALRTATGALLPPVWHADYARARAEMETSLGSAAFATLWHEGQTMGLPQAIHYIAPTL